MTITDTCKCGAKFSVSTGNGFGSTAVADMDGRRMYERWLNSHSACRAPSAALSTADAVAIAKALRSLSREAGRGLGLA